MKMLPYQLLIDGKMFARLKEAEIAVDLAREMRVRQPGAIVHLFEEEPDGTLDLLASWWPAGARPPEALLPRDAPPSLFAGMPSAKKQAVAVSDRQHG